MSEAVAGETGGSLSWAVRDSFLRYVTVIAGGSYTADGVELNERNQFVFPLVQAARRGDDWHFWFTGTVNFTAHQGFLDVTIQNPEVTIGPAGGLLSTNTPEGLLHVAELSALAPNVSGDTVEWNGVLAALSASAVPLFGDVYPAGTELSALNFTATLVSL